MKIGGLVVLGSILLAGEALAGGPPLPPGVTAPAPANTHTVSLEDYPAISRALHEEGTVILKIKITEEGRVSEATVDTSSGFPRLDQAAADVVKRDWLYKPATKDGKPMAVTTKVRVVFHLTPPAFDFTVKPDQPFIVFRMTAKDYPPEALARKEETVVGLMVVVNEEGKVVLAKPTHASSFPDLDQASVDIAKTWSVKPAEMNGKPVRTIISPIFIWLPDQPAEAPAH